MVLVYERRSEFDDPSEQQHTLYIELWPSTNSSVQRDMGDNCGIMVTWLQQFLNIRVEPK